MIAPRAVSLVVVLSLLGLACDRKTPTAAIDAEPASSKEAPPAAPPLPEPIGLTDDPPSDAAAPPAGPAASGEASLDERRRVIATLLSGGYDARALPESATNPGSTFDRGLRKRLTTVDVREGSQPRVEIGASKATVPIPNQDRVLAGMRVGFRRCYERASRQAPTTKGSLVLTAEVNASGKVTSARVTTGGTSKLLEECVAAMLRAAQFDAPEKPSTLTVTVTFEPGAPSP